LWWFGIRRRSAIAADNEVAMNAIPGTSTNGANLRFVIAALVRSWHEGDVALVFGLVWSKLTLRG
jgi:hypothetical protein